MAGHKIPLLIAAALLLFGPPDRPAAQAAEASGGANGLRAAYAGPPGTWPGPDLREGATFREFGAPAEPPSPDENPTTPEKAALGQRLFDDPRLSRSGQIACATCHLRELGFSDGIRTSFGHDRQRGRRNAQSLFTAAWVSALFWDGRSATLEEQSLIPIANPIEMAADPGEIPQRLAQDNSYRASFDAAFDDDEITVERIAMALAAFQRTLKPRHSLWDQVLRDGTLVLDDRQLRGLHLFRTKAGCANCHNGPLFTDQQFHNIGLTYYGRELEDLGRYNVTGQPADVGRFRTPSLRGLSRTGPYMHNGVFPTLEGIVNYYNAGGARPVPREDQRDDPLFPVTTSLLQPLDLSREEREALTAFLEIL